MKKQLIVLTVATSIFQTLAAVAYPGNYHAARREVREAKHQKIKANRDAIFGDRVGARVHAHAAAREEYRALKHENAF